MEKDGKMDSQKRMRSKKKISALNVEEDDDPMNTSCKLCLRETPIYFYQ
jgi:hypothetical protein